MSPTNIWHRFVVAPRFCAANVILIDYEITIIAMKVMGNRSNGACIILCHSIKPLQEITNAVFPFEAYGVTAMLCFCN